MKNYGQPKGMYSGPNSTEDNREKNSSLGTGYENKPMKKSAPKNKKPRTDLRRY